MNWNPVYSPVWKWMRNHAAPAFIGWVTATAANPAAVSALAGDKAPIVTAIFGALTALGFLGGQYAKRPE